MLQEETLHQDGGKRTYEEPDGELLELISVNNQTLSVLTRVEPDKVETPPVDPTELTVSELNGALEEDVYDWNQSSLRGLLDAEKDGKDRTTAINAIKDKLE